MQFLVLSALIAVAVAETAYPANSAAYDKPSYDYAPQPYSYSYAVKDDDSYNDYSHSESSDGNVVTGSYTIALPDGRTQVVTYKADSNGYVADVKYIGEAKYPETKPVSYSSSYETPVYTYAEPAY
ncbi:putative Cuticular protein [Daphnia magna]|uniref:Putative Cuticular protein n=1 Tax=Daphnia magna TaxID=35525 RepID=A0A164WYL5_9CRUS|nr:putative Cuticular protein [Daphnia magna]